MIIAPASKTKPAAMQAALGEVATLWGVHKRYGAVMALADVSLSLRPGEVLALLGLSVGTVRNYLSEAIGKLGAGNRTQAARLAREKGWP